MNSKKICFIGHRNIYDNKIEEKLTEIIKKEIKNGYNYFSMGTHGEFDKIALSVCRNLRKEYKHIEIEVVITSLNQIKPIIEYDKIFGTSKYVPYDDVKTIMYNIEEEYFKKRILISNKQMIENSDCLICYVNTNIQKSGAKTTYTYAKEKGLRIINIFK
ncbi:MAG: hypothetical protein IJ837_02755 [Clostridia bacterium]|nr:hypothetical protein [Clostridia bacterium]